MRKYINKLLNKSLPGFALIGTIISLSALCITAAFALRFFIIYQNYQKKIITQNNLAHIKEALSYYIQCNGVAPYPDEFGDGIQMECPEDSKSWSVRYMHGFVPYRTIGISREISYDGNKNKIRYSMSPVFGERKLIKNAPINDIRVILSNYIMQYDNELVYSNLGRIGDFVEQIGIPNQFNMKQRFVKTSPKMLFGPYTSHLFVRSEDLLDIDDLAEKRKDLQCRLYIDGYEIKYNSKYNNRMFNIDHLLLPTEQSIIYLARERDAKHKPTENAIVFILYADSAIRSDQNIIKLTKNHKYEIFTRFEGR